MNDKPVTEEKKIEIALDVLAASCAAIERSLGILPSVRVVFAYGEGIETLDYYWNGEEGRFES